MVGRGHGAWDEKGSSCSQPLSCGQAAPEAAHQKVEMMDLAIVFHCKDAERFHGAGSKLRPTSLGTQGELLVWGR